MFLKGIVSFALLALAVAERPYVGLRVPLETFLPQIVGGKEATKGSHPYIVSLQWGSSSGNTQHFCAGSVLDKDWILTAAHCVRAVPNYGTFQIKAAKHNIKIRESNEQTIEVERSIVHEQYRGGVAPYDIALLKLKRSLSLTNGVAAIALPRAESDPTGAAKLCGWGSVSTTRTPRMPDMLQDIDLQYVDRKTCYEAVLRLTGSSPVHETNVCTGPLTGGISACSGDSGGPLTNREGTKLVQSGIVSWGIIPCGTRGAPSVYARVSKFNAWIAKNKV